MCNCHRICFKYMYGNIVSKFKCMGNNFKKLFCYSTHCRNTKMKNTNFLPVTFETYSMARMQIKLNDHYWTIFYFFHLFFFLQMFQSEKYGVLYHKTHADLHTVQHVFVYFFFFSVENNKTKCVFSCNFCLI